MLLNIFNAHSIGSRINPPEEREGWRQEGETPACLGCPPPARRRGSAPAEPENSGGGVAKWGEWPPCWGGGLWKTGGSSSIVTILPRKYFNGSKWHFCCPHCGQIMGWNLASKLWRVWNSGWFGEKACPDSEELWVGIIGWVPRQGVPVGGGWVGGSRVIWVGGPSTGGSTGLSGSSCLLKHTHRGYQTLGYVSIQTSCK